MIIFINIKVSKALSFEDVTDLILWELNSSIDDSGDLEVYEQEGVDYIDELPAYRGL